MLARMRLLTFGVLLTVVAAQAREAKPPPGRARLVRVLGRYDLRHPVSLEALFSPQPGVLQGVDARGNAAGWNVEASQPIPPFGGARCALGTPLAVAPDGKAVVTL